MRRLILPIHFLCEKTNNTFLVASKSGILLIKECIAKFFFKR